MPRPYEPARRARGELPLVVGRLSSFVHARQAGAAIPIWTRLGSSDSPWRRFTRCSTRPSDAGSSKARLAAVGALSLLGFRDRRDAATAASA